MQSSVLSGSPHLHTGAHNRFVITLAENLDHLGAFVRKPSLPD